MFGKAHSSIRRFDPCAARLLRRVLIFSLTAFCLLQTVFAQDDVIRVETDLVAFEISVTDKDGKPVRGLEAGDFRVLEDGVERKFDFFEPIRKADDSRPLALVFALDVSGSMTNEEMERLRVALGKFVERLADYQSYFAVMTFGMEVKTIQSLTNRRDRLEKSFSKIMRDRDGLSTHAYDATDDAIRLLQKKAPATRNNRLMRRAVILITDGFPVGDTVSPKTVIERANAAETSVYSVILPSFSRLQGTRKPLLTPLEASGLIERTGGKSFYATQKDFDPLFKALAEEITATYVLAFYPPEESKFDGRFREVKIESLKGYQVKQNRNGYAVKPQN